MTPATELIFLSPTDTLDDARSLMAVSGKPGYNPQPNSDPDPDPSPTPGH